VPEDRRAQKDPAADAEEPRPHEAAPAERGGCEPAREQRQPVTRVTGGREMPVMGQLADRRECDDRNRTGEGRAPQKNRRAPRKSLVRTGTMRTSLAEFGASIIRPPPMYIET
jgi:hypothetical protein